MITIIHAGSGADAPGDLPADLWSDCGLLVLAGPEAAFQAAALPEVPGRIGGRIMRLHHLAPEPSAFRVLAECIGLFQRHVAASWDELCYRRVGAALPPLDDAAAVAWHTDPAGAVTAFRLAAEAAGDPLLPVLTQELADRALSDQRRFEFLAAALAGA